MLPTEQLHEWFVEGREAGYSYMLICCHADSDTPFPVYTGTADYVDLCTANRNLLNEILEVYDLQLEWKPQLAAKRAMNGPSV